MPSTDRSTENPVKLVVEFSTHVKLICEEETAVPSSWVAGVTAPSKKIRDSNAWIPQRAADFTAGPEWRFRLLMASLPLHPDIRSSHGTERYEFDGDKCDNPRDRSFF